MTTDIRLTAVQGFMGFLQTEWPKIRPTFTTEIAHRCSRCINSEKFSPLKDGLCAVCRGGAAAATSRPKPDAAKMTRELDALLKSHVGKGQHLYDAMLLYSGGKDSTYLLHRLTTEYPALRLLAVMIDSGFASQVALANVRSVFQKVNVDHMVVKPKASLFRTTFCHAILNRPKEGYPLVDRLDGDLSFDIGRNVAAAMGIPLVLIGLAPEQVEGILGLSSFESPASYEESKDTLKELGLEKVYAPEDQRYWWKAAHWPKERRPRVLYPFYAWQLGEAFVRAEVARLNLLDLGKDHPLITNNDLVILQIALDYMDRGYCGFEPGFADVVRAGMANRLEWLSIFEAAEYLVKKGQFMPECVDGTLSALGLRRPDVGLP